MGRAHKSGPLPERGGPRASESAARCPRQRVPPIGGTCGIRRNGRGRSLRDTQLPFHGLSANVPATGRRWQHGAGIAVARTPYSTHCRAAACRAGGMETTVMKHSKTQETNGLCLLLFVEPAALTPWPLFLAAAASGPDASAKAKLSDAKERQRQTHTEASGWKVQQTYPEAGRSCASRRQAACHSSSVAGRLLERGITAQASGEGGHRSALSTAGGGIEYV